VSLFPAYCKAAGLPVPVAEYRFTMLRRWRFDWALPDHKIALEVEGAVWVQGRHTRGSGFVKDMEKYNTAAAMGWRIIRCQPQDLLTEQTLNYLRAALDFETAKR
jgi:very-short-patch-repair endonuclease